jgi:DNA-binding Xre family transcriptional regulator
MYITEQGQVMNDVIPSCLDNIIREHRDELNLRMSSAEDLAELPPIVSAMDNQKQVKATVNEWRIVCLAGSIGKGLMLTGVDAKTGNIWATSLIKAIDLENHLVLTSNSLYRLGSKGDGEPTFNTLLHLCYMLHKWGYGPRHGVPEIFY